MGIRVSFMINQIMAIVIGLKYSYVIITVTSDVWRRRNETWNVHQLPRGHSLPVSQCYDLRWDNLDSDNNYSMDREGKVIHEM